MKLALIAAVSRNGIIGREGALPWRLPADLKRFRAETLHKPVVMGRKTWESLRGPLKKRLNIVLSRREGYGAAGARAVTSFDEALAVARESGAEEAMVIGGSSLYELAAPVVHRMLITHVETDVAGDATFPSIDWDAFEITREERYEADAEHAFDFRIVEYARSS